MSKQFWAVVAVIVLIFVGVFALTGKKSPSSSSGSTSTLTQHVEGQNADSVTLVEYGDYECPFCGQYYPIVKQVQSEYNQQIQFQFRNFPLVSIHQNAFAGARAAEAAGLQGKFWDMHDMLYEQQAQWVNQSDPTVEFNAYASQLGLNVTKFKQDYSSDQVNNLINADMSEGNKLGISGTPSFYLDGKQIQVSESASDFEKLINAEILKKHPGATLPTSSTSSSSSSTSTGTTAQTKAQ